MDLLDLCEAAVDCNLPGFNAELCSKFFEKTSLVLLEGIPNNGDSVAQFESRLSKVIRRFGLFYDNEESRAMFRL